MNRITPDGVKRIYMLSLSDDKTFVARCREAERKLADAGYWIVSPLDIDPSVAGFASHSECEERNNKRKAELIAALHCDGIATVQAPNPELPPLEIALARALLIPVMPVESWILEADEMKEGK